MPPAEAETPSHPKRARLHLQILGGFLGLQAVVLAVGLAQIESAQSRRMGNEARQRLMVTRSVFASWLDLRKRQSALAMTLLSKDFALRQAVATRDRATILSVAENARNRIGAARVWIFDESGRPYASRANGAPPPQAGLEKSALESGDASTAVLTLGTTPYQLIAVPINAPDQIGGILAAFSIDDSWAAGLKRTTLSDVSFVADGKIAASTLDPEQRGQMVREMPSLNFESIALFGERDQRQIALRSAVGESVSVVIQRSWKAETQPLENLRRTLLFVGLLGFAISALLGYFIAENVANSINRLVERLQSTNEELSRLNGFQTKFFTMVAHDVKNPLSTILACTQILHGRVAALPAEELEKLADLISRSSKTLTHLISDLVDFAAIENGLLRVKPREMDLSEVISAIRERTEILAQKRGVRFVVEDVPALPKLNGDPERLAQILQNLCGNALQYTPEGGTVTLKTVRLPDSVRLSVTDTGIGIAKSDQAKIFRRFFQATNAREIRGSGFGLGLKIAREIAEAHRGAIDFTSELGKGSTFNLTLPLPSDAG